MRESDHHANDAEVRPEAGLGVNFDVAPSRALELSARGVLAGEPDPHTWGPVELGDHDGALASLREDVSRRDGDRCVYCGLRTSTVELDSVNDNHGDLAPDNHVAADPLCHGYHHLKDLGPGNGRLAYLPGLDRTDVNHLQRMIAIDLHEGDEREKAEARDLLNWLASHGHYVSQAFGSEAPEVFGNVLTRVDPSVRQRRGHVFEDMALIYNPRLFSKHASVWAGEVASAIPRSRWAGLHQDVFNLTP